MAKYKIGDLVVTGSISYKILDVVGHHYNTQKTTLSYTCNEWVGIDFLDNHFNAAKIPTFSASDSNWQPWADYELDSLTYQNRFDFDELEKLYKNFWGKLNDDKVAKVKCECGCTATLGKDDYWDLHSAWCPVYVNKGE